jgi:hypothetical protein
MYIGKREGERERGKEGKRERGKERGSSNMFYWARSYYTDMFY